MHRTVYGKITLILLVLFLAIAALNIVWTLFLTRVYIDEANQKLNRNLARYLVSSEFSRENTVIDSNSLKKSFNMLMSINPNIELYLLDTEGKVVAYSAPPGKKISDRIPLEPVTRYIAGDEGLPIRGDDPRNPGSRKVFSAAPIPLDGAPEGYLYIILSGEEHDSVLDLLQTSYIAKLSIWVWASALLFLFVTGLLLFNYLTRRHRRLADAVESFRSSDFRRPIPLPVSRESGSGDEIDRLGAVFSDMSQRIFDQISDLEQADQQRRELVSNISHDLRMPLAALQGHLETILLKQEKLTGDETQRIEQALKHAERLGRLISELMELSTLDSPKLKMKIEPFQLAELVQDIAQDLKPAASEKNIKLAVSQEEVPLVRGDIGLIERAVGNLLANSISYTPEDGSIYVEMSRTDTGVLMSVSDDGRGISPDDLPHIFERFYRGKDARDKEKGGTGLGLAIARRIIQLHGGDIEVRSEQNEGSIFTFSLPIWDPDHGQDKS